MICNTHRQCGTLQTIDFLPKRMEESWITINDNSTKGTVKANYPTIDVSATIRVEGGRLWNEVNMFGLTVYKCKGSSLPFGTWKASDKFR